MWVAFDKFTILWCAAGPEAVFFAGDEIKPEGEQQGACDDIGIGFCAGWVGIVPVEEIGEIGLNPEIQGMEQLSADEPGAQDAGGAIAPPLAELRDDAVSYLMFFLVLEGPVQLQAGVEICIFETAEFKSEGYAEGINAAFVFDTVGLYDRAEVGDDGAGIEAEVIGSRTGAGSQSGADGPAGVRRGMLSSLVLSSV